MQVGGIVLMVRCKWRGARLSTSFIAVRFFCAFLELLTTILVRPTSDYRQVHPEDKTGHPATLHVSIDWLQILQNFHRIFFRRSTNREIRTWLARDLLTTIEGFITSVGAIGVPIAQLRLIDANILLTIGHFRTHMFIFRARNAGAINFIGTVGAVLPTVAVVTFR